MIGGDHECRERRGCVVFAISKWRMIALLFCQSCSVEVKKRRVVLMKNVKRALPEVNWDAEYEYFRVFLHHDAVIPECARFVYHVGGENRVDRLGVGERRVGRSDV